MKILLLALSFTVAFAPVAPSYGCRCDDSCAADKQNSLVASTDRGARQDFCPCCTPQRPHTDTTDGTTEPRRSEVCSCRQPAPMGVERNTIDLPKRSVADWTFGEFAAASRAVTPSIESAAIAAAPVEVRLRV